MVNLTLDKRNTGKSGIYSGGVNIGFKCESRVMNNDTNYDCSWTVVPVTVGLFQS